MTQPPYNPRGAARELMYCKAPEVLIEGPAGTGKTRAVLEKCYILAAERPNVRILIVRKTRASMTESVLVTFEHIVCPPMAYPIRDRQKRKTRQAYVFHNDSTIVVGGMDNADRIMSTDYDVICVFESTECDEDDIEKLTTRLRNHKLPFQQLIADCNPSAPTHWLNRRANKWNEEHGTPQMQRLLSRHEDNPLLYDEKDSVRTSIGKDYISKLDALTGARRERLRFGRWATAEGIVYDEFDAAVHCVDRFVIPREWRRIRSVDFGYTNPFSCSWWAINPDGDMYRYRQIYMTGRLVEDHARQIAGLSKDEAIEADVVDHDAEDRATYERHAQCRTIAAKKDIGMGIQAVKQRLKPSGKGKPRIFFMRDSLVERDETLVESKLPCCTEDEFDSYPWPKDSAGKAKKELPVDKDNHGLDECRYAVMYVDGGGRGKPTVPTAAKTGRTFARTSIKGQW